MNEMAVHRSFRREGVPQGAREPVLSVSTGSKIYGGVHAIEGVDFDLYPGEVHALVGENGAGKSTAVQGDRRRDQAHLGTLLRRWQAGRFPVAARRTRRRHLHGLSGTSLVPTMTARRTSNSATRSCSRAFAR
jgi:simple sugar transport system ATP-binding protein